MVQSYMRHGPTHAFGLVCSAGSNSIWDGKLAYVPALEDVLVWDVKRSEMIAMWHETGHHSEVTCIERSLQGAIFAVGYADGSIKLWNSISGVVITTLNGHRKPITALAFDSGGVRLASGSQDTAVILWDIVSNIGLYRLHGHRGQITAIKFISLSHEASSNEIPEYILSVSKDTFMKLWRITTQHCMQTVVAHSSEVWSLDVNSNCDLIVTGSGEGEVKTWRINRENSGKSSQEFETEDTSKIIFFMATLPLSSRHRISQLLFLSPHPYLAIQTYDKTIDIFRILSEEEITKRRSRRKRRGKDKLKANFETQKNELKAIAGNDSNFVDEDDGKFRIEEIFTPHRSIRASDKIRSFDFPRDSVESEKACTILLSLTSNALEVFSIPTPNKATDISVDAIKLYSLEAPGHRTQIRSLSISSDDSLLASISNDTLKVWNLKTMACLRSIECRYAVCGVFLPGDRQLAVGARAGEILLFDIGTSAPVEIIKAHTATIWSIHVSADGFEFVSGSADKDVKFWHIEGKALDKPALTDSLSKIRLVHVRTLKLSEDVLSVRYSPDGKLLAVSLIDSTVKVFYRDSLKFFLSLYGHKLPVVSMDISDDSKIIVTCSADKNIKIWGLDFGDCHRSIFGHDESITQIAFEKNSHYFWTVSRDRLLKYWDGDKFKLIQNLYGHLGEIRALATSNHGNFVVTASYDKSIRLWEKLDEPLFLEEELENEMELSHENQLLDAYRASRLPIGSLADKGNADVVIDAEAATVSKHTRETLISAERIIEALDIADVDIAAQASHEDIKSNMSPKEVDQFQVSKRHPILEAQGIKPEAYVLRIVEKISGTALTDALVILPFNKVLRLINFLDLWARQGWNIALVSRIISFLIRIHHHQIVMHHSMRKTLISLRQNIRIDLQNQRNILNYNLSALSYVQRKSHKEHSLMPSNDRTESPLSNRDFRKEDIKRKRRKD